MTTTLRIGTGADDLARLYPWLDTAAETLELPKPMLHGMHVALEEAVMNVVMHAYQPDHIGQITVLLRLSSDAAELVVEDHGHEFDSTKVALRGRPATLSEAEPGGMGLTLLRHYCREVRYERDNDRNRLTMRFPLS